MLTTLILIPFKPIMAYFPPNLSNLLNLHLASLSSYSGNSKHIGPSYTKRRRHCYQKVFKKITYAAKNFYSTINHGKLYLQVYYNFETLKKWINVDSMDAILSLRWNRTVSGPKILSCICENLFLICGYHFVGMVNF